MIIFFISGKSDFEDKCIANNNNNSNLKKNGVLQDYKTYLDFVLALENRKEPQVGNLK